MFWQIADFTELKTTVGSLQTHNQKLQDEKAALVEKANFWEVRCSDLEDSRSDAEINSEDDEENNRGTLSLINSRLTTKELRKSGI